MFQNFFIDEKYADVVAAALNAAGFTVTNEALCLNGYLSFHVDNLHLLQAAEIAIRTIIDCEHDTDERALANLEEANRLLGHFEYEGK